MTLWARIAMTCTTDIISKPSILWLFVLSSYLFLTEFIPFIVIMFWVNSRQKKQTIVQPTHRTESEQSDNMSDNGQSKSRFSGMEIYQPESEFTD